jgi:RimJ/RimL family protein N-acetyltransferase
MTFTSYESSMMTMITFRPVAAADSADLFEWRNDRVTREASVSQDPVSRADHERWFGASLALSTRWIYLAIDDESTQSVGMCRFDLGTDGDGVEVSINLNPAWRGRGIAFDVLTGGIARFREDHHPTAPLSATIRTTNRASARIFTRAGFTLVGSSDPYDYYRLA